MLVIDPKVYSLIKVAETGSYTRAAEQLSLTQPAVSQHIRALEGELGIRIFERVNNELRITHEGETAIKYAKRMLSLYNNLQRDLTSEKRQLTQLTVGITHTAESNAISEALAKYVNNHEGVTVKIITDTLSNLHGDHQRPEKGKDDPAPARQQHAQPVRILAGKPEYEHRRF